METFETSGMRHRRSVVHRHEVNEEDVSRAKQEFHDQVDIRRIANRYLKTGLRPVVNRQALYADFSQALDLQSSLNLVQASEEAFNALPRELLDRFGSVAELVEFVSDDANLEEAVALGALTPEEAGARGWNPPPEPEQARPEGAPEEGQNGPQAGP